MSNISDLLFEKEECSTVFLKASEVGERLNTPVYLVGGSVRDLLMNKMEIYPLFFVFGFRQSDFF